MHFRPTITTLTFNASKLAKLFCCASALVLAGCATNPNSALNDQHIDSSLAKAMESDALNNWLVQNSSSYTKYPSASEFYNKHTTMASTAMKFLGVKYRYGGDSPGEGFDCSGLVAYAAEKSLGLKLPRTARAQAQQGEAVKRSDLKRGDLVFFNTLGRRFSHVGIYIGDGKFVHSPRAGASIRVESMSVAYWNNRYNGARRIAANTNTASR